MKIWVTCIGEPLPIDRGERQHRMSLLADALTNLGHEVVWWTTTFDHYFKRQRFDRDTVARVSDGLTLQVLHAREYKVNISLDRLMHHREVAGRFVQVARATGERPDVMVAAMPAIELAAATARLARDMNVPMLIDIRDLHPDIYLSLVPRVAAPVAKLVLQPLYRELRDAVRLADGIVGISPSFLQWALGHAKRAQRADDAVFPLAYPKIHATADAIASAGQQLRQTGVDPDRKIVWYVGAYNRWIDLAAPIEAARLLAQEGNTDVQFVFSGKGEFEPQWRQMAAGLPNVVFTGWIGIPQIMYMRSIAYAGLAPYRAGFHTVGNKLFEYMAGALPILLSIGGDAKELVEKHDCGIAYQGDSGASLRDAIHIMMNSGVRERFSRNALAAYENHYSGDKVHHNMAEFIVRTAERRNVQKKTA